MVTKFLANHGQARAARIFKVRECQDVLAPSGVVEAINGPQPYTGRSERLARESSR
jgi:hypothetical protein